LGKVAGGAIGKAGAMQSARVFAGWAVVAAAVCLAPALAAQDPGQANGQGQPARAIRLSFIEGKVRLSQADQVLAEQAAVNTPLLEGMALTTADDGKAEIQFEDGSVARIPPDSSLTLSVLRGSGSSADAELTLNSGLAYFELQSGYQNGKIVIHFAGSTVTSSGFTVLRVTMDRAPGQVAVFSGNAHLESANGTVEIDLHDGESVALNGADPGRFDMAESIAPDSWDSWNSDRDQVLTSEEAAQTGAPAGMGQNQNPAWSDLDANGSWYDVPGQGYVWSPYEAANAGWDPYGNGNWIWTPGFGYIWASGYPWGYLPFQCGAWNFYNGFGWGWAPGFGGCTPWWGVGFYGGPRFGYVPPGYRIIPRPILPRRPALGKPVPVVAINRGPAPHIGGQFPVRNGKSPVVIAGTPVRPLTPIALRPEYSHPTVTVLSNHEPATNPVSQGPNVPVLNSRPGYARQPGWTPGQGQAPQHVPAVDHGPASSTWNNRVPSTSTPSSSQPRPSSPPPSPAPAPHPSNSGGSSGGNSHPGGGAGGSSGGGGGGGHR